jgi:hypothetical protein
MVGIPSIKKVNVNLGMADPIALLTLSWTYFFLLGMIVETTSRFLGNHSLGSYYVLASKGCTYVETRRTKRFKVQNAANCKETTPRLKQNTCSIIFRLPAIKKNNNKIRPISDL